MNNSIRNKRMISLYLTGDYSFRQIGKIYKISDGRVSQIIEGIIGKEKIKDIKNMRKHRVAERMREDYLKTIK